MNTIQHPIRRHEALTEAGRYARVSLPFVAGIDMTPERAETAPTLPTIREPRHAMQPADRAAITRRQIKALAATICAARSGLPAVTVAMEGSAG